MNALEIRAEIGIIMLELGTYIDRGMSYSDIKKIYEKLKQLQFLLATTQEPPVEDSSEIVMV